MGHIANDTVSIAATAQDSMQGVMELQLHYKNDKSFRATGAYKGNGGLQLGGDTQLSFDALEMKAECGSIMSGYKKHMTICKSNPSCSTFRAQLTLAPFEKPFTASSASFTFDKQGHLTATARASSAQYESKVQAQTNCVQVVLCSVYSTHLIRDAIDYH